MPPGPRDRPALERNMPGDNLPAGDPAAEWKSVREPWRFLFGDGEWHSVQLRAEWKDRFGRRIVQITWSVQGMLWGDSFVAEENKMRETPG